MQSGCHREPGSAISRIECGGGMCRCGMADERPALRRSNQELIGSPIGSAAARLARGCKEITIIFDDLSAHSRIGCFLCPGRAVGGGSRESALSPPEARGHTGSILAWPGGAAPLQGLQPQPL